MRACLVGWWNREAGGWTGTSSEERLGEGSRGGQVALGFHRPFKGSCVYTLSEMGSHPLAAV